MTADEEAGRMTELMKAVNSIPAYVERCTHFLAICPTIQHRDLDEVACDFASWLERGWCRVELYSLLLARHNSIPAIVVKGSECAPFMISPSAALPRSPGLGRYTCCDRGHVMVDAVSGKQRRIPCDKSKVGAVIWNMLQKKREYHLGYGELLLYRLWTALSSGVMEGLVCMDMPSIPTTVEEFLAEYRFDSPTDEENSGSGYTPLILATISGNDCVVRSLITRHNVNVNSRTLIKLPELSADKGGTALHAVSFCPREQTHAIVTALLAAGADPHAIMDSGGTVLMTTAMSLNEVAAKNILDCCADTRLDLEQKLSLNSATALGCACYQGTTEIVELLLDAGADRAHKNDHGGTPLIDACCNAAASPRMLELLVAPPPNSTHSAIDINYQAKPRNAKWAVIDMVFRMIVCNGISRSNLAMTMAHSEGATVSVRAFEMYRRLL